MKEVVAVAVTSRIELERDRKEELLENLSKEGDIVVFPELFMSFDKKDDVKDLIGTVDVKGVLIFGAEISNERKNSLILYSDGKLYFYDKVHLTKRDKEHGFTSGREIMVVNTKYGKIGLGLCYDLMFPEHARILALKGADIIVYSSLWISFDYEGWDLFTRTRCRENQVFGIFSNGFGKLDDIPRLGLSRIVSPFGRILAQSENPREDYSFAKAVLDPKLLEMARGIDWPKENYFKERKPHLYKDIVKEIKFI